jgi:putative transposase
LAISTRHETGSWSTHASANVKRKIERWHQTLKNRILLENYYFKEDLEAQIKVFIDHYNHHRYHESLGNVTPADAYYGRASAILRQRQMIKLKTLEHRRSLFQKQAA